MEKSFIKENVSFAEVLTNAIDKIYKPAGFLIGEVVQEAESIEYGAHRFRLDDKCVVFRVAKTTPTKIGQFVTLWKRPHPLEQLRALSRNPLPIHCNDGIDFVVVHVHDETQWGQFIFNREILIEKGIIAAAASNGKTGFRIYPPWSKPVAADAIKLQKWQCRYFVQMGNYEENLDMDVIRGLFRALINS